MVKLLLSLALLSLTSCLKMNFKEADKSGKNPQSGKFGDYDSFKEAHDASLKSMSDGIRDGNHSCFPNGSTVSSNSNNSSGSHSLSSSNGKK